MKLLTKSFKKDDLFDTFHFEFIEIAMKYDTIAATVYRESDVYTGLKWF